MLLRTVVLLTSRVKLLIKGVAPAVCPVIVIVVSSPSLAATRFVRTIKTALLMIEHVFMTHFLGALFPKSAAPGPVGFWDRARRRSRMFDLADYFGVAKRALEGRRT